MKLFESMPRQTGKSVMAQKFLDSQLDAGKTVMVVSIHGHALHKRDRKTGWTVITAVKPLEWKPL